MSLARLSSEQEISPEFPYFPAFPILSMRTAPANWLIAICFHGSILHLSDFSALLNYVVIAAIGLYSQFDGRSLSVGSDQLIFPRLSDLQLCAVNCHWILFHEFGVRHSKPSGQWGETGFSPEPRDLREIIELHKRVQFSWKPIQYSMVYSIVFSDVFSFKNIITDK
jgi:hypothetical protein